MALTARATRARTIDPEVITRSGTPVDAEATYQAIRRRVARAHSGEVATDQLVEIERVVLQLRPEWDDPRFDRWLHVDRVVRDLWLALDRGENVAMTVRRLHRAAIAKRVKGERLEHLFIGASGRTRPTSEEWSIVVAIALVAKRSDDEWRALLRRARVNDDKIDALLCEMVRSYVRGRLDDDVIDRLALQAVEVAASVRLMRSKRGRPLGAKTGTGGDGVAKPAKKWIEIAKLLQLVGLRTFEDEIDLELAAGALDRMWKVHGVPLSKKK